ncbi:MAG: hypothetical protein ACI9KE_005847 [Polyangiales bacterium]|jgi:hypothetical protein
MPESDAARPDAITSDARSGDARVGVDGGALRDGGVEPDAVVRDSGRDAVLVDTGIVVADVAMGPCGTAGCTGFVLRDGASAWTAIPADATSAFAPATPVVAAFDIESVDLAYVVTGTTFHVLRPSDGAYIASGSLTTRFPGLSGFVLSATSIPAGHGGSDANLEGVTFATRDLVFPFAYNLTTGRFTQNGDPLDYSDDWSSALAPDRNAVLGGWLALENEDGWAPGSPRLSCAARGDEFVVYLAYLADGQVHFYDAGQCFDFVARVAVGSFGPFQLPGAPDFAGVGGSFYHQGDLWMLNATPR